MLMLIKDINKKKKVIDESTIQWTDDIISFDCHDDINTTTTIQYRP